MRATGTETPTSLTQTNITSHGLRGGEEAAQAWSVVVGLSVDRLEVERGAYEEARGSCEQEKGARCAIYG